MRRAGWAVLGAAATPIAAAALLVAEWKLAKRGPQLASTDHPEDGRVGGDGPALRMVWLGDSLVTGAGATTIDDCLPRVVARGLGRPVEVVVLAVAGARISRVADEQAPRVTDLAPDLVVVCVGTNDVLYRTPLRAVWNDYQRILAALPDGVPVVVVGPGDFGAVVRLRQPLRSLTALVGRRIAGALRSAASMHGATYVDLIGAAGPALRRDPARLLAVDQFHPSDAGYRVIAHAVLLGVREALTAAAVPEGDRAHR